MGQNRGDTFQFIVESYLESYEKYINLLSANPTNNNSETGKLRVNHGRVCKLMALKSCL